MEVKAETTKQINNYGMFSRLRRTEKKKGKRGMTRCGDNNSDRAEFALCPTRLSVLCLYHLIHSSEHPYEVEAVSSPTVRLRKLVRQGAGKSLPVLCLARSATTSQK